MPLSWQSVKPSHQILVGASIGVLALVGTFTYDNWTQYRVEIADAEESARRAAQLMVRHTELAFDGIDSALQEVARVRLETGNQNGSAQLNHRLLEAVHGGNPVLKTIGLVNEKGIRTVTSMSPNPPPLDLSKSEAFLARRDQEPGGPSTFVSAPRPSRFFGVPVMYVTRRIATPDERFLGLAYGVLDPMYFSKVFETLDLGEAATIVLSKSDGTVLATQPAAASISGLLAAGLAFSVESIGQDSSGSLRIEKETESQSKVVGFAVTQDRRFIVSVSIPLETALAAFHEELFSNAWRLLLAICLIAAVTAALVAQIRRREGLSNQLRESERRFRDFAKASGDWFWETDPDHRMSWLSKSVATALGTPADWHIGKRRRDMYATHLMSDADSIDEHEARLDRHETFNDFEYPRQTPGGVRWIRTSGVPRFDEKGRFLGYRGSARDITDFIDAKARLKDAADALPGGFLLFDSEDKLVFKNAPTQQPTGLASFENIGDTFEDIARRAAEQGLIEEARENPEEWVRWRLERHRSADRPSLFHVNGRAIEIIERPTSDGDRVLLRFDVTDRELAIEELRHARDAADAANQAKSDFLASMSHELRTPLNAIIGFGEILEGASERRLQKEQISEYSSYVVSSGRLLLSLVSEVLDLASIESGHMKVDLQSVDVRSIVEQAIENVRPLAAQKAIDLRVEIPDKVGTVLADSQRATQVLLNLLSNAIKYNSQKGYVRVEALEENEKVTIMVTDSGPGISPIKVSRLFSPFDRLGAEFGNIEGTGIGLALCKRLTAAMSGQIGYHPAEPTGSTFWFTLPASQAPIVSQPEAQGSATAMDPLKGITVLCIEDSPISLRIVEHVVKDVPDLTFLEATTGTEGLNRAQARQPDTILLDLNLPDMSGLDVLAGLRANPETATIPVIALTASAMPEEVERGTQKGFFRYLRSRWISRPCLRLSGMRSRSGTTSAKCAFQRRRRQARIRCSGRPR